MMPFRIRRALFYEQRLTFIQNYLLHNIFYLEKMFGSEIENQKL